MTEDRFFQELFARLPRPPGGVVVPPGDDCAAVTVPEGRLLLFAVDQVVGGRHYVAHGPADTPPRLVGRKVLARNLSDVAAMGGTPTYCVVSAALPPQRSEGWLNEVLDGVVALAAEYGVHMIGGDLSAAPHDEVVSLAILGEVEAARVCRRGGARAGDLLLATGRFGDSFPSGHHLSFVPRLREGQWLAGSGAVTAMIDVSDGLLLDASRLARASGQAVALHPERVPLRTPQTSLAAALHDGEDYELLAAVRRDRAEALLAGWPFGDVPLTALGEFVPGREPGVYDGRGARLDTRGQAGYDHLQGREANP
ncbi:MAG: Thiamine-monophosphate kinase [Lentisphaerae bacterium ADurb.BinA184]|nr:MAG: Thiamine-monophosphate kinase [Lentisphaerae bacterium ADurb.BinA184]